jgi:hypothetical protein
MLSFLQTLLEHPNLGSPVKTVYWVHPDDRSFHSSGLEEFRSALELLQLELPKRFHYLFPELNGEGALHSLAIKATEARRVLPHNSVP